jgi:hypothetical protein
MTLPSETVITCLPIKSHFLHRHNCPGFFTKECNTSQTFWCKLEFQFIKMKNRPLILEKISRNLKRTGYRVCWHFEKCLYLSLLCNL